ncbi:MAG TPA: efflux RND transporter periplasmic adaptor subunit [Syntrophales bacterium]|nr:efflux RND transporter periplasmic adaptor subunit [Geobacteraceae bacterium]HPQ43875.1 efflux RND transporter periplasmic adaptor subunit [Syntrophales bacterium]
MAENQVSTGKAKTRTRKRVIHIIVSVTLIVAGIVIMGALTATRSQLEKVVPPVPIPAVRVTKATTGPQTIIIRGEGTVQPLREINLVSEVGGKIVRISPDLVNGGSFTKGNILLAIDPVDYELAVTLAKAQVKDAESSLKMIQEEALVAREEWRSHYSDTSRTIEDPPPLVAKKPQLEAAHARLEASRADLEKALLDLERTVLKAPFDGRVGKKFVDLGQYVTPGQALAELFSTEAVEIALPIEDETLFWFDVPGFTPGGGSPSPATVHAEIAGRNLTFSGKVIRAEGKVDEKTRMITIIVRVEKPYATKPPLAIGLFVTVDISGRMLPDAAVIPRAALHQGDIVWIVDDSGILHFRPVRVARHQGEEVVVESGIKDGEMIVFSTLKAPTDGMTVRAALEKE